ncbi:MAG: glucans biosynthesis glucosyltransferase MdoH [Hyphomonadaceae bacterium]|nr:glucans biosynthesis glucosyltransferase MdoH [Hyphomonadaceae bacterium]
MPASLAPLGDTLPYDRTHAPGLLPADAPLGMPRQPVSADARPYRMRYGPRVGPSMAIRRTIVFGAAILVTIAAFSAPLDLFRGDGFSPLELTGLALFCPLFIGISLWFCNAVVGFILVASGARDDIGDLAGCAPNRSRTALLAPIRNEDVAAVYARLRAMDRDLAARDSSVGFDFFVLSDTNDGAIASQETVAHGIAAASAHSRFYYRRRLDNTGRKAGNVADWVRRFGGGYDFMVVLDADSVMSADALLKLAGAMEARPDLGLIQSIPTIVGAESLFARHIQFGMRLYGRIAAVGMAWWAGTESPHWGHNAIVRVEAFAEAAALPRLSGDPPFGGEILSHDVVEGWFMRRAGWGVAMAPTLAGSYEETPPTLQDNAQRDARWCQGNLQHIGLLNAGGLHWLNRLQLLMAVMIYAAAPLWLAFLTVGVTLRLEQGLPKEGEPWFSGGAERLLELHWSIILTVVVLFSPKLLGAFLILVDPAERRAYGGANRLGLSVLAELLMSALIAPMHMLSSCRAIAAAILGRDGGWGAQRRRAGSNAGVWQESWSAYGWMSFSGLCLALIAAPYSDLVFWMAPIIIGLVLAAPLAAVTSSTRLGAFARKLGVYNTPEESEPPEVLRDVVTDAQSLPELPSLAPAPDLLTPGRRLA